MINWKELEKFITPGKVCTLVIIIDGKEIGAFSFNIETLAYKEVLEVATNAAVSIAEKAEEKKVEPKKSEPKKAPANKNDRTKAHPEFNPVPAHEADEEESVSSQWTGEDDSDDSDIDIKTGEIKEKIITPHDINTGKATVADAVKQATKSTVAPVSAAAMESDDIIPEEIVITDKVITPGKNEINFEEEKW